MEVKKEIMIREIVEENEGKRMKWKKKGDFCDFYVRKEKKGISGSEIKE